MTGLLTSMEQGAHCQLWAATGSRDKLKTGMYYEPVGVEAKRTTKQSNDQKISGELWNWLQKALKEFS